MKSLYLSLCCSVLVCCLFAQTKNARLIIDEDARAVAELDNSVIVSYADVLDSATPSVVAVYTSRIVQPSYYYGNDPFGFQNFLYRQFGRTLPQQPVPEEEERLERVGVGSGVILSEDGYIITNHHVVQVQQGRPADEIRVRLGSGEEYVAELVGSDEKTDVAVLKIEAESPLPSIPIASSAKLRVGDIVFAIGNPLDVGLTATQGIISALGRNSSGILGPGAYEDFIQTDASINPGNSGGALIDAAGRLIGINTAIVSGNGGSIGIGFAIPSNLALNVVKNLIESGDVPRGLLGLVPVNLNSELVEAFGLDSSRGALVNQVQPDSPAANGGIRHGDVIVKVDDTEIESAQQLRLVISQIAPGTQVTINLIRQGKTLELPVVLGSLTGPLAGSVKQDILDGVLLGTLNDSLRQELAIPDTVDGVIVTDLAQGSSYSSILSPGMVILEVNGRPVTEPSDISDQLQPGANRFYVLREGNRYYIVIYIR